MPNELNKFIEALNKPEVKAAFEDLAVATERLRLSMKMSTVAMQAFNGSADELQKTIADMTDDELGQASVAITMLVVNISKEEVKRAEKKEKDDAATSDSGEDNDPDGGRPEG